MLAPLFGRELVTIHHISFRDEGIRTWDRLQARLRRFATWPAIAILLLLVAACSQGFEWRRSQLGYETRVLGARFGYSPQEAIALFDAPAPSGRHLYALSEVTLDVVFPSFIAVYLWCYLLTCKRTKYVMLIPSLTGRCSI